MRIQGFNIMPAVALALAAGAAVAQPAGTRAVTGDEFRAGTTGALGRLCGASGTDAAAAAAATYCHGFLSGVAQFHRSVTQQGGPLTPLFCEPQPLPTHEQVARTFAAWVQANPQHASEPAVDGLVRFAQVQYPCPAQPAATRRSRGR